MVGEKPEKLDRWTHLGGLLIGLSVLSALAFGLYGWLQFAGYQADHVEIRSTLSLADALALKPEQDVAEWTYSLIVIGVVGSLLSVAGIVVVGLTLRASREAVAAAQADTKATREIGENQNRCYVQAISAQLLFMGNGRWRVEVKYHNSGLTPAVNVRHAICVAIKQEHTPEGQEQLFAPNAKFLSRRPIPAGETDAFGYEIVDYLQASAGVRQPGVPYDSPHAKFLSFIGAVIYEDVFGVPFRTEFEFKLQGQPPTEGGHGLSWGKTTRGGVYERHVGNDRIRDLPPA